MSRAGLRTAWVIAAMIAMVTLPVVAFVIWDRTQRDPASLAQQAYARGDWVRAEQLVRGMVRPDTIRSADSEAVRIYARTLARLGRDSAAIAIYEGRLASAELEPEDAFLKGLVMTRTGRPETAFELWGRYTKQGVDHPEMLDHFSRLAARYQRMDPALDAARRLSRQPGWEARGLFTLGQLDEFVDDPPGVVAALADALQREPEARGALFDAAHYRKLLARNLLRLGRAAEAERYLTAMAARTAARPPAEGGGSASPGRASLPASRSGKAAGTEPRPAEAPAGGASSPGPEDAEAQWLLSRAYLQQDRMPEAAEALARSGTYGAEHRLTPEPGPYVGSSACAPCHRDESRAYDGTRHTRSFYHGDDLLGLPMTDRPVPDPDDPEVLHTVAREAGRVVASSRSGDRISRMVVEYAFGTPERYQTMIARDDAGIDRAVRVSHYRTKTASGWGPTAGDVGHSDSPEDRLGQRIDVRDGVVRCLYCHVTRSRDFRDPPPAGGPTPAVADRGIGCERCHGPGGNHLRAIARDFKDSKGSSEFAIVNVAGTPAATANGQCVECHTVGLSFEIERAPDDPRYVRSPGVTFAASRCFSESGGALSCMTCHDPHREAEHSAAFYEAKCLACHSAPTDKSLSPKASGGREPAVFAPSAGPPDSGLTPAARLGMAPGTGPEDPPSPPAGKTCPVNPAKDCLTCHMPRVPMPALHTTLTDHYIRIRRDTPPEHPADGR